MSEDDEEFTGKVPAGQKVTWEEAAEAMRMSTGALATAVYGNLEEADIAQAEAMTAIAAGALAWAVDASYRYWKALGMEDSRIRADMNRNVTSFWKQAVEKHAKAVN